MKKNILNLPNKGYGSICLKIMTDFAEYHKIPIDTIELPCKDSNSGEILSSIMSLMVRTFDEEKKKKTIEEVQQFKTNQCEAISSVSE